MHTHAQIIVGICMHPYRHTGIYRYIDTCIPRPKVMLKQSVALVVPEISYQRALHRQG